MFKTAFKVSSTAMALLLVGVACAAETAQDDQKSAPGPADETGGSSSGGSIATGGGAATGGTLAATGGVGATGGTLPTGPAEPLPAIVTDLFGPSGFMGREGLKKEVDGITMDPEGCPERAPNAAGLCYAATFQPQELDMATGETWAGVFFQNPEQNWGEEPGVYIEAGATKIVFTAWAVHGGQKAVFLAGGIGNLGTAHQDTFKVEKEFTLTDEPTAYELDLSSSSYLEVLGGFGWVLKASSMDPIVIYMDDIRWVK